MSSVECKSELRNLTPLSKVVRAAIADSHEDIGKSEELYSFWAARGLRKLLRETLRFGVRRVYLYVNHNTKTANLPVDFKEETFVGVINTEGYKEALLPDGDLIDTLGTVDKGCEETNKCERCTQPKSICEDLQITESENIIKINGASYTETVVRKLYPNGDYTLETTTPVLDTQTNAVTYQTATKYITNLDLKVCGCLETTPENIEKVRCCCEDVYNTYYAGSCGCSRQFGSYKIFEETGRIQFDPNFPFNKVYLEYVGFMPKIKGDYYVPEVAFETLVEWTKFKSIDGKSSRSVPNSDKKWRWDMYLTARRNMDKELGRVSLSTIIEAAQRVPKFDISMGVRSSSAPTTVLQPQRSSVQSAETPAPAPVVKGMNFLPWDYTGVGGETTFTLPELAEKYILMVSKDGIIYSPIIFTGTPVGKQVKYTAASGTFEFNIPIEFGENVHIIYG